MEFQEELVTKDEKEINMMSPLTWAYVGDSIYEMYIRTYLSNNTNLNPHKMHIQSIKYVKASSQAEILKKLEAIQRNGMAVEECTNEQLIDFIAELKQDIDEVISLVESKIKI